tara:strand:- start:4196 stop:4852 length:657 start_codon:yes stop_codon:yes gene_type:complete
MFQWTERFQPQQEWITISIFFIFILFVYLHKLNKNQFKLLFSFWDSKSYYKTYYRGNLAKPINSFNLILTLISLITFSLLGYFFYEKILLSFLGEISFLTFFIILSVLVIFRYGMLKLIFQQSNQLEIFKQTVFRSINFYALISLYTLLFISIYNYRFNTYSEILFIISILILCVVFFTHLTIYIRVIRNNPQNLVYLILYLCAFKIAPWLWLYKLVY